MKLRFCLYIIFCILFLLNPFTNSRGEEKPDSHAHNAMSVVDSKKVTVDVEEKIGNTIPLDIELVDENQTRHKLKNILDKPTILALIYYYCPGACSLIQGNLANALNGVPAKLGQDYQVLSVSFDHEESPKDARRAKANYTKIIEAELDQTSWRFFTGSSENIQRITEAVGFKYQKLGPHQFIHPNLVTVVAGDGKIIRYLYGTEFLPFDIGMAVAEALQGTPGVSIKKFLSYCFEYDPEKNRYAFKLIQVFGIVTLTFVAGFIFFLIKKDKRKA